MENIILSQFTKDELASLVEASMKRVLESTSINNASDSTNQNERLTRKEIREIYKISYPTIHVLMKSGKLPFEKVGRKTLFKKIDLENYLSSKSKL